MDTFEVNKHFAETKKRFQELKLTEVELRIKSLKQSSMNAQPSVTSLLRGSRKYIVHASPVLAMNGARLDELPPAVLIGWFAHELGHIVHYERLNVFQLMIYLVKYFVQKSFRKYAERSADLYALEAGFRKELLETKNWILKEAAVGTKQRRTIDAYYLTPSELEQMHQE